MHFSPLHYLRIWSYPLLRILIWAFGDTVPHPNFAGKKKVFSWISNSSSIQLIFLQLRPAFEILFDSAVAMSSYQNAYVTAAMSRRALHNTEWFRVKYFRLVKDTSFTHARGTNSVALMKHRLDDSRSFLHIQSTEDFPRADLRYIILDVPWFASKGFLRSQFPWLHVFILSLAELISNRG